MLLPSYLRDIGADIIALYYILEDIIIGYIADYLYDIYSETDKQDSRQTNRRKRKQHRAIAILSDLNPMMRKFTQASDAELRAVLQDAVIKSYREEEDIIKYLKNDIKPPISNRRIREIIDAECKKAGRELKNLTRTTMLQSQTELIKALDEAELKTASGRYSYEKVIREIINNLSEQGLTVDYPSGARRSLESAVRTCIVTSVNQTAAQVTNAYIKEAGAEYVLVSAHIGARVARPGQPPLANHSGWQGRVYKIRGSEPGIENLAEATGYDIDADGTGHVLDPLGLHGYNCRHSHKPWDKDLRNPYRDEDGNLLDGNGDIITDEQNKEMYEKQQKQRALERGIRKTKRKIVGIDAEIKNTTDEKLLEELKTNKQALETKLQAQNKQYNDYCKQNDLAPQYYRSKVKGFRY